MGNFKLYILSALSIFITSVAFAQTGGQNAYAPQVHLTTAYHTNLEEAITAVRSQNMDVLAAREEFEAQKALVGVARAPMYPQLSTYATVSRNQTETESQDNLDRLDSRTYGIRVTQNLFAGGKDYNSFREAQINVERAFYDLQVTESSLILSAIDTYFNVLRYQSIVKLSDANYQVLGKHLDAARAQFAAGRTSQTDVTRAQSRRAQAYAELISAQADLQTYVAQYQALTFATPGILAFPAILPRLPNSLTVAMEFARKNNATLNAARLAAQAGGFRLEAEKGGRLPSLDLEGSFTNSNNPSRDANGNASSDEADVVEVSATLSVPIFSGFGVYSSVENARHNLASLRNNLTMASQNVDAEITGLWYRLDRVNALITARKEEVTAGQVAVNGLAAEYITGTKTILDLLDAEQDLYDARVALIDAQCTQFLAAYSFLDALGDLATGKIINSN